MWKTPVTDRVDGRARMTYLDMNRITQNLNYLYDLLTEKGYTVAGSKVSQDTWTQNDIIEYTFWFSMLDVLDNLCDAISYPRPTEWDDTVDYEVVNLIESTTQAIYDFTLGDLLTDESGVYLATESGEYIAAS